MPRCSVTNDVPCSLIISADDFGLHSSVNRAIRKAHTEGVLTHASLMTQGPAFEEAVEIAGELPDLGVGVHLTLPGNLSGEGQLSLLGECCNYALRRSNLTEIWRHQIAHAIKHGIMPTHLDSHQHTHFFPGIFPVVWRLAEEFEIKRIRWLEFPQSELHRRRIGELTIKCFQSCSQILHDGRNSDIRLIPAVGFGTSGNLDRENLKRTIDIVTRRYAGQCVEIFCHPGDDNIALQGNFGWAYDWETELNALVDSGIKSQVAQLRPARKRDKPV